VSPDPDLARLGFELAGTISANLDGIADLRSVDRLSISAQVRDGDRPLDLPASVALGRRLGASSVVYGTLTRAGPSIRLDLRLHATASASPIADPIMLVAPADSVVAITDSVTRMLLRQVWRNGRPPTPNLGAALGTRSLPALRAFLRGERAVGLNRWIEAADAFRASFGEDSTFWLASWRYDNALRWVGQSYPTDSLARRAYLPHLASLPPSDRELVEANLVLEDSLSAGLDRFRRATERYPTNWIAWMELGDHLLHMGGLLGNSRAESRRALERATELNPGFVPAWQHLVWLYAWARDTAAALEAHTRLRQLGAGPGLSALWPGSDYLLQQRLLLQLVAGGGSAPAALLDSVAGDYARASWVVVMAPISFGYGSTQIELLARARRLRPDPAPRSWEYVASVAWSQRGAWDSAATALERWGSAGSGPSDARRGALYAFSLRAIGAWLGALDPAWVEGQRGAAEAGAGLLEPGERALLAWSSGVLALAAEDAPALERARSALGRVEPYHAALAASLAAFGAALRGEPRQAADSLASLERRRVEGRDRQSGPSSGVVMSVNRLAAVRWFLADGDTTAAMRLLRWTETVLAARYETARFQAYALFHLGGILEARGDSAGARHAYEGFLQSYDLPPAGHRWMVDSARAGLSRLEGQPARQRDRAAGPQP
jgi:tetratricopeptide (TPR) repeat protein